MKTLHDIAKEIGWSLTDDFIAEAEKSMDDMGYKGNRGEYVIGYVNGKYLKYTELNREAWEDQPHTD